MNIIADIPDSRQPRVIQKYVLSGQTSTSLKVISMLNLKSIGIAGFEIS